MARVHDRLRETFPAFGRDEGLVAALVQAGDTAHLPADTPLLGRGAACDGSGRQMTLYGIAAGRRDHRAVPAACRARREHVRRGVLNNLRVERRLGSATRRDRAASADGIRQGSATGRLGAVSQWRKVAERSLG